MSVAELKELFFYQLNNTYPKEEIESFYFLLVDHILNLKRIDLALNPNIEFSKTKQLKFEDALVQLQKERPIQYIIGETEFFSLNFKVNEHVLIPRPETEELVDWIVKSYSSNKLEKLKILDIGTGSGCIPISLAKNLPNAFVYSIDISPDALKVARKNAILNTVEINFIKQDILTTNELNQQFDIIISNPPYVRELEKKEIKDNVLKNEPHLALFVKDNNPLLFYDKITDLAKKGLKSEGTLYFEINQYLGKETLDLLKRKKFSQVELRKDLSGNNRMIKAQL
ncbi:MAG: protein-(glutamine-N5) methyltransferase, release factor-specific [Bacteroidetes bacterium MedPE-SWsnd-G1]|nr:MAG: protein-(glutamine-N5) methyltransferase, release factor-specific [Bacteroidetes bacterium MedPE-SWsnd-G1]